ncbi:MAG: hypothetical protein IJY39_00610 [Clostridia bacterium]|nr:hypothetical protein [Clostridia bacterium]
MVLTLRSGRFQINADVLSNGYICFSIMGLHLYEIGTDASGEIIDLVKSGEPDGYVWNEEHSEWSCRNRNGN